MGPEVDREWVELIRKVRFGRGLSQEEAERIAGLSRQINAKLAAAISQKKLEGTGEGAGKGSRFPEGSASSPLSPGGIDFNSERMNIEIRGEGGSGLSGNYTLPFDITTVQGFTFRLIGIQPVKSLGSMLKAAETLPAA